MRGWDLWSRVYLPAETLLLGGSLMRSRQVSLDALDGASRVLLLGDGDGRFLVEALARRPSVEFVSVDGSAGMIAKARARVGEGAIARVRWLRKTLPEQARELPSGPFDGVVSQFFLDCFDESALDAWWPEVARRVRPGGFWHDLEFTEPARLLGWRWLRQAWLLRFLFLAFNATTDISVRRLPRVAPLFRKGGWSEAATGQAEGGLYHWTTWRKEREDRRPNR